MDKPKTIFDKYDYPEMEQVIENAIAETDKVEEAKMVNGEEEVLPPMTPAELDAFLNAEDEALKEDRGDVPVADQLEPLPMHENMTLEEVVQATEHLEDGQSES